MKNKSYQWRNGGSHRSRNNGRVGAEPQGRNGAPSGGASDFLPLVETVLHRWPWLILGAVVPAALACALGLMLWKTTFTAPAQLIRYDSPNAEQVFGARQAAPETLPSILHSPELLHAVADKSAPPVSADTLMKILRVMPEHDSDIIVVTLTGNSPTAAANLANLYADEAVKYTKQMQVNAADEVIHFATQQIEQIEREIKATDRPLQPVIFPTSLGAAPPITPRADKLVEEYETACDELAELLAKYTDAHPQVQAKRAEIAALSQALAQRHSTTNSATGIAATTNESISVDADRDVVVSKLQSLESARLTLLGRKQAAAALVDSPPGYCQLLAAATESNIVKQDRKGKIICLTAFMGLLGCAVAAGLILLVEVSDNRLKSAADVKRVARLPVLASMGDTDHMTENEKRNWAFRTWTRLQGRLSPSPNHGLICGFTSASEGEGRTTWVHQLAEAAHQLGFRVLTIATQPADAVREPDGAQAPDALGPDGVAARLPETVPGEDLAVADSAKITTPAALAPNVLSSPAEVAQKLMGAEPQPVVHIPLPGWVWNLERRKQWQAALQHWSQIENVVILVELPPASKPEAVLLAQNLPNLVWLTASGQADAAETREHLQTLHHARCNLAGAVLNRATASMFQRRFCRWLGCFSILLLFQASVLHAADQDEAGAPTNQPVSTPLSFSALATQRAPWQKHLTLGPGDVLSFGLYGEPTLSISNVLIRPDGRVSYLEAQDVLATGLTVDELRTNMDNELAKYRRTPHCIVSPVVYNSKKYFILGSVARAGVFSLDRPTTIIEAVARARGLQTVLQQRNLVEIADVKRAFLIRQGQRMTVDFEKLFQQGDLSQNITLAPNDYLYFPSSDLRQVYVVGEVLTPGIASLNANSSAMAVIAEQGGFSTRAWKKKFLVIRGSLQHPQTFVIDANAVLSARAPDFKLEPDDIVYVSARPWIMAEEVLDLAASAFVQSAVISWTDLHVGPRVAGAFVQ